MRSIFKKLSLMVEMVGKLITNYRVTLKQNTGHRNQNQLAYSENILEDVNPGTFDHVYLDLGSLSDCKHWV